MSSTDFNYTDLFKNAFLQKYNIIEIDQRKLNLKYKNFEKRINSYDMNLWSDIPVCIDDMVNAGFYSVGNDDHVECFSCGLRMKDWEFTDDPFVCHYEHSKSCLLLRMNIDEVNRRLKIFNDDAKRAVRKWKKGEIYNKLKEIFPKNKIKYMLFNKHAEEGKLYDQFSDAYNDIYKIEKNMLKSNICIECKQRTIACVFLPCGHASYCSYCGVCFISCSTCNAKIEGCVKIAIAGL